MLTEHYKDGTPYECEYMERIYYISDNNESVESKNLLLEVPFINGRQEGEKRTYARNGDLVCTESFVNGKTDGVSKEFSPVTLSLIRETEYKNGKKYGTSKNFLTNGMLTMLINWKDNQKEGLSIFYSTLNGAVVQISNYKEDKLHGVTYVFNENCVLAKSSMWEHGYEHGRTKIFGAGVLLHDYVFVHGTKRTMINKHYRSSFFSQRPPLSPTENFR